MRNACAPHYKRVMKKPEPRETKDVLLTIRIRPSTKAMAEKRAREDERSLASYIELLIRKDAEVKK